jgi:hypothetical protein
MYSSFTTFLFVLVLLGIFIPNVGSIDLTVDIITLLSLSSVVPLTHFLQKEYLHLKQAENKILILEEKGGAVRNQVDEALANKIIKFAARLRQPVNDVRQVALQAMRGKGGKKHDEALHKIAILGKESLDQIERFEEAVTGKTLLHTHHKKR